MPNLSVNISGYSDIVADTITVSGRATAAGFTSSTNGTIGTPAYNFSSDTDCGIYHSGVANRYELAAGGSDVHSIRTALSHAYVPFSMGSTGTITGGNFTVGTGRKLILDNSSSTADTPLQFAGDPDTGIHWDSANDMRFISNGSAKAAASTAFAVIGNLSLANHLIMGNGSYIEMTETTAPAGATDKVRIYAVVDGGSKTDLAAIFQSGASQVFAQEP